MAGGGNTVYGKSENRNYKFLLLFIPFFSFFFFLFFFPFPYIHLVNLTRITFVTGNMKGFALSAYVANGIPLKLMDQAVACFAPEVP